MPRAFPELSGPEEENLKAEARAMCRVDLHYLAKQVLGYSRVTDGYHRLMAREIDTPRYRFKLLLHPRGHFKSTLGTEAYSIQRLLREAGERILITNVKLSNSRKFLRAIAHHFGANPLFRWVWRDWWLRAYATPYHRAELGDRLDWVVRDTQDEFTVLRPHEGREASITTGALDASMVSQHYSLIIADDLVNREFVRSVEGVERSILYLKDLLDLLDPDGELLIIGTRWAHLDLYNWIIEEFGGVASLRVPDNYVSAEVRSRAESTPEAEKRWLISVQPCYQADGSPIFPEEYSHAVLESLKQAKGPYEFGAQYLLNPTPREDQKFQEDWFQRLDALPAGHTLTVCITVDPAKSLADSADNTAMVVCGYDEHNRMYLLDGVNEKLTVDELLETLYALVQKWYQEARLLLPVGFEAVGFQETYIYSLERMMMERGFFFGIEAIKRRVATKEERILRLVPRLKHGFYVPRTLLKTPRRGPAYDLVQRVIWELTRFPFAGTYDLADALADQLEIVRSGRLPVASEPETPGPRRDFTHASLLEDRRRRPQPEDDYDDAVQ